MAPKSIAVGAPPFPPRGRRSRPFGDARVERVFAAYPEPVRPRMLALRELILRTAETTDGVGPIEETLRWGEPAYLPSVTRSGTAVRIDWKPARPDHQALYVHCRTDLIATFRTLFPDDFAFEGNRALLTRLDGPLPAEELTVCIAAALTYHRRRVR